MIAPGKLVNVRLLGVVIASLAAVGLSSAATAASEVSVDGALSGETSSNPFLLAGDKTGASAVVASLSPTWVVSDAAGSQTLSGNFELRAYSRRYDATESARVNLLVLRALAPRLDARITASYDNAIVGIADLAASGTETTPLPAPSSGEDIALTGQRSRRVALAGDIELTFKVDAKSHWTMSANVESDRYPSGDLAQEYNDYGGQLSYGRAFGARVVAGLGVSVAHVDYLRTRLGDATIVSPVANWEMKLNPRLTISGYVGASIVRRQDLDGSTSAAYLAASVRLCEVSARSGLCLEAVRSTTPSALGTVRSQVGVTVDYRRRLNPRDDLTATLGYTQSSELVGAQRQKIKNKRAEVTLTHELTKRIAAFGSLRYAALSDGIISRDDDGRATVGLRVKFGDRK